MGTLFFADDSLPDNVTCGLVYRNRLSEAIMILAQLVALVLKMEALFSDYHPRSFADVAAASSNACLGSLVPL